MNARHTILFLLALLGSSTHSISAPDSSDPHSEKMGNEHNIPAEEIMDIEPPQYEAIEEEKEEKLDPGKRPADENYNHNIQKHRRLNESLETEKPFQIMIAPNVYTNIQQSPEFWEQVMNIQLSYASNLKDCTLKLLLKNYKAYEEKYSIPQMPKNPVLFFENLSKLPALRSMTIFLPHARKLHVDIKGIYGATNIQELFVYGPISLENVQQDIIRMQGATEQTGQEIETIELSSYPNPKQVGTIFELFIPKKINLSGSFLYKSPVCTLIPVPRNSNAFSQLKQLNISELISIENLAFISLPVATHVSLSGVYQLKPIVKADFPSLEHLAIELICPIQCKEPLERTQIPSLKLPSSTNNFKNYLCGKWQRNFKTFETHKETSWLTTQNQKLHNVMQERFPKTAQIERPLE